MRARFDIFESDLSHRASRLDLEVRRAMANRLLWLSAMDSPSYNQLNGVAVRRLSLDLI